MNLTVLVCLHPGPVQFPVMPEYFEGIFPANHTLPTRPDPGIHYSLI